MSGSPPRRRSVAFQCRLPTHVRVQANVGTADELRSRDRPLELASRRRGVGRPDVYRCGRRAGGHDCTWQWQTRGVYSRSVRMPCRRRCSQQLLPPLLTEILGGRSVGRSVGRRLTTVTATTTPSLYSRLCLFQQYVQFHQFVEFNEGSQ